MAFVRLNKHVMLRYVMLHLKRVGVATLPCET